MYTIHAEGREVAAVAELESGGITEYADCEVEGAIFGICEGELYAFCPGGESGGGEHEVVGIEARGCEQTFVVAISETEADQVHVAETLGGCRMGVAKKDDQRERDKDKRRKGTYNACLSNPRGRCYRLRDECEGASLRGSRREERGLPE